MKTSKKKKNDDERRLLTVLFVCVQVVQLVLDQCAGVVVNELEGVGADTQETDESGCRAAGETPGNQR